MEGKKKAALVLLVAGTVILVLSLIGDLLGIGRSPGFGWNQILGIVIGAVLTIVGVVLKFKKPSPK